MGKGLSLFVPIILLVALSMSCASAESVAPQSERVTPGPTATVSSERALEMLVTEAQKEGTVTIYAGSIGAGAQNALVGAFRQKYGIDVEIIQGRAEQQMAKITRERSAGLYTADMIMTGFSSFFTITKPLGITVPIEPLLVLPEVRDLSKWRGGKLPLADPEGHFAVLLTGVQPMALANSDMVRPSDIKNRSDLLDPKWRGKISMNDPTLGGGSTQWLQLVAAEMGMEKATAYFEALAKQEVMIVRDYRQQVEWAARGKYPVTLFPDRPTPIEFIRAGAPLFYPEVAGTKLVNPGAANVTVFDRAPHPNATKLFVNWLMNKDAMTIFSKSLELGSTRVDVSTEWVHPALLVKPDEPNFVRDPEKWLAGSGDMAKLAGRIFGVGQ